MRLGLSIGVYPEPDGKYPLTSTITSVATLVYTHTRPDAPNLANTKFGIVSPATKFRFDASGRSTPHGYTVTYPTAAGFVTVKFNAAAAAFGGTPPTPPTCNSNTSPASSAGTAATCDEVAAATQRAPRRPRTQRTAPVRRTPCIFILRRGVLRNVDGNRSDERDLA